MGRVARGRKSLAGVTRYDGKRDTKSFAKWIVEHSSYADVHPDAEAMAALEAEWTETREFVHKLQAAFDEVYSGVSRLWMQDKFPLFGHTFRFTHVLGAYLLLVVVTVSSSLYFQSRRDATGGVRRQAVDLNAIRAELVRVYTTHAPENVAKVDEILAGWKGREHEVVAALHAKYLCTGTGTTAAPAPAPANTDNSGGRGDAKVAADDESKKDK